MKRIAAFAAVLLTCSPTLADPPVVRVSQEQQRKVCNQGVCRIERSTVWGTGTVIGRDESNRVIVLSCGHGWGSGPVDIWFRKGDHREGRILAKRVDGDVDIGLIAFTSKADVPAYPLGEKAPSKGHALTTGGWGDGTLKMNCVDADGYFGKNTLVISTTYRQGDSGGPVLWDDKLVGVVNGNMDRQGVATSVKACRAFVQATLGSVPGPVEEAEAPPVPPPLEPVPAAPKSELLVIMERLDRIERRLDLLSTPFPKVIK